MKKFATQHRKHLFSIWFTPVVAATLFTMNPLPAQARTVAASTDKIVLDIQGQNKEISEVISGASLLQTYQKDKAPQVSDLFTAAKSDYARILSALYAKGYFSAVIRITIDGQEAANIPPLNIPGSIKQIKVFVDPGPQFKFSKTKISPLAPDTQLSEDFRPDAIASTNAIESNVNTALSAWRDNGHAKVEPQNSDIIADHKTQRLAADVSLNPGPKLTFGKLTITGQKNMIEGRLYKIAGYPPQGTVFSPKELRRVENRLRRTGVFSSVSVTEEDVTPGTNEMPISITVSEQKPRHYAIGAELATQDGAALTGNWMHRNLRGGAERLRVDGEIRNIGNNSSGEDYSLGVTIDRPATFGADTTASLSFKIGHQSDVDTQYHYATFGGLLTNYRSEELTLKAGLDYTYVNGKDPQGNFIFRSFALPLSATWDRRDNPNDARKRFYIDSTIKPFRGLDGTESGVKATIDARGYHSFGRSDFLTIAARVQAGVITGSNLLNMPRNELFYTGGGGSVRGQPYQSLGINVADQNGESFMIGGSQMVATSVELRTRFTSSIGAVIFYDHGAVAGDYDQVHTSLSENFQAGAGIGLRYETGFGPIRLDVATPVSGKTNDGVQIYIGLGQSF